MFGQIVSNCKSNSIVAADSIMKNLTAQDKALLEGLVSIFNDLDDKKMDTSAIGIQENGQEKANPEQNLEKLADL